MKPDRKTIEDLVSRHGIAQVRSILAEIEAKEEAEKLAARIDLIQQKTTSWLKLNSMAQALYDEIRQLIGNRYCDAPSGTHGREECNNMLPCPIHGVEHMKL